MVENHLYTPVDQDGTKWQLKLKITLTPNESLLKNDSEWTAHLHSAWRSPSAQTMETRNTESHQCIWQIRLWAETQIDIESLMKIGVLDPTEDQRLIVLAGKLQTPLFLRERVFFCLNENESKKAYMSELPKYVALIEGTSAKHIKKKLFCRLIERKKIFGQSTGSREKLSF